MTSSLVRLLLLIVLSPKELGEKKRKKPKLNQQMLSMMKAMVKVVRRCIGFFLWVGAFRIEGL
jgi:hypothetical protein